MKNYEITFITKEDPSTDGKDSFVKKDIEAAGGNVLSESKLGQKNFTYRIRKEQSGFYTSLVFAIEPEKLQDLNRRLQLEEQILRFLIISINPKQELIDAAQEIKPAEIPTETKTEAPVTETAIIEPETEIVEAPKTEIIKPETEIVAKEKTEAPKVKKTKEPKKVKEEKPAKKEKKASPTKPAEEPVDEESRLEALDKKLEELLKE